MEESPIEHFKRNFRRGEYPSALSCVPFIKTAKSSRDQMNAYNENDSFHSDSILRLAVLVLNVEPGTPISM